MAVNVSYTSSSKLADADDRRHRLRASALSRESLIFLLFIPEERIGTIAYTWVDGESKAGAMALVFERENEKIVHAHVEGVPVSPDRDFDDWEVGFLRVQHGEPHRDAHVSFSVENVSLDYTFQATTPAFCYHDNRDGCPTFLADNRFEQSGRVSGVLTVGDRVIPFDTTTHRDHSWGTRDWRRRAGRPSLFNAAGRWLTRRRTRQRSAPLCKSTALSASRISLHRTRKTAFL